MIRTTGSKLHRVWQCPASALLPQNTSEDLDARTEPARGKGHVIHKYLEEVRTVGVEEALSWVAGAHGELAYLCRALDIDRLPTHLSTEVAFAWNWQTRSAQELGRNLGHRDYDALGVDWSCEIPITVDVCGARDMVGGPGGALCLRGFVGDYKTGWMKYPRPERFGQLLLGAACVRSVMGCDDVIAELLYIDESGDSFPVRDLIDGWLLDAFEMQIADVMGSMPALEDLYNRLGPDALPKREGPHCAYCPAFKACNAKTALVRAVPAELLKIGIKPDIVMTPRDPAKPDGEFDVTLPTGLVNARNAAAIWEATERVKSICKSLQQEVTGIAYNEPVTLSDGRVIERYEWKKRKLDGRIAAAVLERHFPREAVLAKLDIGVSLTSVTQLAQAHTDFNVKPRPVMESAKGTGVVDKLIKEIDQAKGVGWDVGEAVKPRMPRKKRGA